jgi:protein ImuB
MSRWAFVGIRVGRPASRGGEPPVVLAEALMALSSMVAVTEEGVWLEVGRSAALFGSERALAREARAIAARLSCAVSVTIADRPETARLLALARGRPLTIVAPGRDARALAPLSLEALGASPRAQAYLARLGLRRAGALARLAPAALRRRLGAEGEHLGRLARAAPGPLPERYQPPERPEAVRRLEPPLPPSEAVLFVVKTVLDELTARLAGRGLAIAALRLTLAFEGGTARVEEILLPRPLRTTAPLLALFQERLLGSRGPGGEQADWPARITAVEAQVLRTAQAPVAQLSLLSREEGDLEELSSLLVRLSSTLGQERVFAAAVVSSHQPEAAWRRTDFLPAGGGAGSGAAEGEGRVREPGEPGPHPSPRPILVVPAPLPLEGALRRGAALRWQGGGGTVQAVWGPERLRGQWWGSEPFDRDYHVVDLREGARVWVYRDRLAQGLYLQGIFD